MYRKLMVPHGMIGVKGRMWHVIKNICEESRSVVLLEGEKSAKFARCGTGL